MPRFVPEEAAGGPVLQGIAGGGFRVDGVVHRAVLLTPVAAMRWDPPPIEALDEATLMPLITATPEFILLGTGTRAVRPPHALAAALDAHGIGLEVMDSRAAARAWVIVRGEGRQVAAALMALG